MVHISRRPGARRALGGTILAGAAVLALVTGCSNDSTTASTTTVKGTPSATTTSVSATTTTAPGANPGAAQPGAAQPGGAQPPAQPGQPQVQDPGAAPIEAPGTDAPPPDNYVKCTDKINYAGDPRSNAEINIAGERDGKCPDPITVAPTTPPATTSAAPTTVAPTTAPATTSNPPTSADTGAPASPVTTSAAK